MDILRSINETDICELRRVSNPEVKSKHLIICVTGFMQEDQDKESFWKHLIDYYKHAEIYAVSWNALTMTNFLSAGSFTH